MEEKYYSRENNVNIGFEKQIWDVACVFGGISRQQTEYRKVIIVFIFLHYILSAFERHYQEFVLEGEGQDDGDTFVEDNIFFMSKNTRWGKIAFVAHTAEIATVIDDSMRAMSYWEGKYYP